MWRRHWLSLLGWCPTLKLGILPECRKAIFLKTLLPHTSSCGWKQVMQGDGGDICLNSALPNMKRCCTLSTYYLVLFHSLNEREDGPWTP